MDGYYVCLCTYKECGCGGTCQLRATVELYDAKDTLKRFTAKMCLQCAIEAVGRKEMVPVNAADIEQREASIKSLKIEREAPGPDGDITDDIRDDVMATTEGEFDVNIHSASLRNGGWE